jgi:hypothetical protein
VNAKSLLDCRETVAATGLTFILAASWASAARGSTSGDKRQNFGALAAPATLPEGAASAYVYGGAQELAAGYRQGVSSVEVEARAKFNYFLISFAFEVLLKHVIAANESAALAPFLGVGFVHDTGSRYFISDNFKYTGARVLAGAIATYRVSSAVSAIAELDVPLDLSFSPPQVARWTGLAGGGAEIYLGSDFTALLMGQLGVSVAREPLGVPQWSVGYQVRAGFGYRFF